MPEKFVWTEKYSVGIKMIDEQHQNFFAIANSLIDLAAAGHFTKDEVVSHIARLGEYALYHLSTEEEYLSKFACESAAKHILAHNFFRDKVRGFLESSLDSGADLGKLAEDVAGFANHWLSNHILVVDKGYTECFHQHGLY